MNYSNFDSRITGKFFVPEERLRALRELQEEIRRNRKKRRLEKTKKGTADSDDG